MKALTFLPLLSACYNPPNFDYDGVPVRTEPEIQLDEIIGNVADECHAALFDEEFFYGVLWPQATVEPELTLEGENLWLLDSYQVIDANDEFVFPSTGVYASFDATNSYCYGEADQVDGFLNAFDVSLNLSDPACGGLESIAQNSEFKLHFFHEDQGECIRLYFGDNGGPSIYSYVLNLDMADPEAAYVVREDREEQTF